MLKGPVPPEVAAEIKRDFAGVKTYKGRLPGTQEEFVARTMNWDDYNRVQKFAKENRTAENLVQLVNEKIFDACILWPRLSLDEKITIPIGVIPTVVKTIQEVSGFLDVDIIGRLLRPARHIEILSDVEYWDPPEAAEVEKLKAESSFRLSRVVIDHKLTFVIRPMTKADVYVAQQAEGDELAVVKSLTVWPKEVNWDALPGGYIELLGDAANKISGWDAAVIVEEL